MVRPVVVSLLFLLGSSSATVAQSCVGKSVAVQILGSGGPDRTRTGELNKDRAETGYILWVDSQAKLLVDMGGGSFLRFAQTQARFSDLSMILISHLHPDHVSDLPALLWSSRGTRSDSLPVIGPSGNDVAPSISAFLSRLFDEKTGAFEVLAPGNSGVVRLDASVVDVTKSEPSTVFERDGVKVTALGIPHADVPTLAYRVQTRDGSVVFSSDQNGTNPRFPEFARAANVLIMHMAVAAGDNGNPRHASPAVIGRIAQEARVGKLIVSHINQYDLDAAVAELKSFYTGPLTIGADLQCTTVR
jgi:ribonuclease BN (tRNA processing enzyme)